MNENMIWTDSQDYGADEILFHPFALTPPEQRAACALHFEGLSRTNQPPVCFWPLTSDLKTALGL